MSMEFRKLYLCDPSKNKECKKTDCGHLGTGKCFCTTNEEYQVDGYLINRPRTNQDKVAEMFRRMDPDELAEILDTNVFICDKEKCPICKERGFCDKDTLCREVICEWLKEEVKED